MTRVILLGTSAAVPTREHAPTSLLVEGEGRYSLVDCGDNPLPRLSHVGLDPSHLHRIILSHFHPDHVSGVPLLLVNLWLTGRRDTLYIAGLEDVLDRLWVMMDLFRWDEWQDFYPLVRQSLGPAGGELPEMMKLRVTAAPGAHSVPSLAFRFETLETGHSAVYSADTEPSEEVARLAQGANILFHEATGEHPGHSSPAQAGEIARQAGVERLVLIHYPPHVGEEWVEQARERFGGPVELGQDLQSFTL